LYFSDYKAQQVHKLSFCYKMLLVFQHLCPANMIMGIVFSGRPFHWLQLLSVPGTEKE
jgi:hypothetical protein